MDRTCPKCGEPAAQVVPFEIEPHGDESPGRKWCQLICRCTYVWTIEQCYEPQPPAHPQPEPDLLPDAGI